MKSREADEGHKSRWREEKLMKNWKVDEERENPLFIKKGKTDEEREADEARESPYKCPATMQCDRTNCHTTS